MPHDWQRVSLTVLTDTDTELVDTSMQWMHWYGEYLWQTVVKAPKGRNVTMRIEAVDIAGNTARSPVKSARGTYQRSWKATSLSRRRSLTPAGGSSFGSLQSTQPMCAHQKPRLML